MWLAFALGIIVFVCVVFALHKNVGKKSEGNSRQVETVTVRVRSEDHGAGKSIDDITKELLQEAIEAGNEEDILYYQRKLEKKFQEVYMDYLNGSVRLSEMKTDQRVTPEQFEKACNEQIKTTLIYRDMFEKYYNTPLNPDVFKIYAMFLEKQGRYLDAARVCARALDLGFPNDRTQGGMAGRLVRMVKKAGGETTPEIEDALNRFCK